MAARPTDRPEIQVFDEIGSIDHLVRVSITRRLPVGLTYPQYEVLNYLIRVGEVRTPARIALDLQMTKGAITNTLQRLTARHLIKVESDVRDRRKKHVTVEPAGKAAYNQAMVNLRPRMENLRGGFTEREFREALPFLRALRTWLEETE
jgi:DNA-binding MarR family transcriptional regulator